MPSGQVFLLAYREASHEAKWLRGVFRWQNRRFNGAHEEHRVQD